MEVQCTLCGMSGRLSGHHSLLYVQLPGWDSRSRLSIPRNGPQSRASYCNAHGHDRQAIQFCRQNRSLRSLPHEVFSTRQSICGNRDRRVVAQAVQRSDDESVEGSQDTLPLAAEEMLQYMGINSKGESGGSMGYNYEEVSHDKTSGYKSGLEVQEGYVGLFVRLLGLDNAAEDRENAVLALWRHSMAGAEKVNEIVVFPGCLNLIVSLLPSDRQVTAEAAAGLLRNISAIEEYRSLVADAGAVEEIGGLLTRHAISTEVREQAVCVLWNVSFNERERKKIAGLELLPVLFALVESEEEAEKEAAVGVLANMSSSPHNHSILTEAGIIPKFAKILLEETTVSKVTRQEARNALLELAKNFEQRLAIVDAGLVPVPLIGASAYRSFKPLLEAAPLLPEDIKLAEIPSSVKSMFGAGELLLGLKTGEDAHKIDDATRMTIEGKVRQQFLARIGVIEKEGRHYKAKADGAPLSPSKDKITFMPWWEGIPRLVLILGLEDLTVARKAAESLAEIAINEDLRQAIHKAGAVVHLVRLLGCGDEGATESAALALEMLGKSQKVRRSIDAHGAVPALVEILRASGVPQSTKERVVSTLLTLSQAGGEIDAMIQAGAIPGLMEIVSSEASSVDAKEEAEEILEEISSLKPDSRDRIVAAGGLPPLIDMLATGTTLQAEKAASVLENLATEKANAEAMINAGVESAILLRLDVNVEEDEPSNEDAWMLIVSTSKLLERLVRYDDVGLTIESAQVASQLLKILQAPTSPLYVKNWVSPCLWRLQQQVADKTTLPIGVEITIHDRIPRLVEEIGETSGAATQEKAALELQDLVSQGVGAYLAAIASAGGIFSLVNLLENSTAEGRSAALAVLYNLGMDEENHVALLAAGVVPPLKRLVKQGLPDWKLALYLLRTLPT